MVTSPYRLAITLFATTALAVLCCVTAANGQTAAPSWYFEDVSAPSAVSGCVTGAALAGFDIDAEGRPVAAWREDNACGAGTRVFWTRWESGAWQQREFFSPHGNSAAHRFAIRPSDGNPFMVYNGMGLFFEVNAYLTDLGLFPNGGSSSYLENIVPPQNCSGMNTSLAFGPGDLSPQRAIGIVTCNGQGPLRLNGSNIRNQVYNGRPALAVSADGTRHLLWNTGTQTWYSRVPAGQTAPDHEEPLFVSINRFGGEVAIAVDGGGVIHAVVGGAESFFDGDTGAIMYARSTDGGTTWSPWEYVDIQDELYFSHLNTNLSLAVDDSGTPSVASWRWGAELWYSRRDGPNGSWTYQLVTTVSGANTNRDQQVRFDRAGSPVIAFVDPDVRRVRLARPIPQGATMPVDVSVTLQASATTAAPGATASYMLTVTNQSAVNLPAVLVTLDLPDGVSFIDSNPQHDLDGSWTVPLNSGASRVFTVNVTLPGTEGTVVVAAQARSNFVDASPGDNAATAAIRVGATCCDPAPIDGIDVSVTLTATPPEIAPTGVARFIATVTNRGNVALTNVPITFLLPNGASLFDIAPGDAGGDGNDRHVILPSLAPGESRFIVVRLSAFQPSTITLTASHGTPGDVIAGNDRASAVVVVKANACFVVPSDLVARWRGDGNGEDDAGGHTALLRGNMEFGEGRLGRAFQFVDRTLFEIDPPRFLEVPDNPALRPGAFTIAGWINASAWSGWSTLIAKGASGVDPVIPWFGDTYWLGLGRGGYPTLYTHHASGTTVETTVGNPITINRWYHLAATYDGSVARLYLDGVLVAENTINEPLHYDSFAVPVTIGEDWQGGSANGAPFTGRIDDVLLYSRALSGDDVRSMIDGSSSECVNHPPIAVDDVVDATVAGTSVNVVANDSDPDGDAVTIAAIATPPSHGTASFSAQSITYTPIVFNAEVDALTYRISDGRGGHATATLTIMLPVSTSIGLQSSPRPSVRGAAVTLTAHVTAPAAASVPAGLVTFHNVTSNTHLGAAALVNGTAALTVATLPPGTNLVRASYAPIGRFLPSSVDIEQVVIAVDDVIRNGDIETRSQYDAVGAIEWSGGSCSATLLSRTVALTAAQCVYNVPPQDLQFRIRGDLSAGVAAVLVHPQFIGDEGANLAFDVALVRLDAAAVAAWPAIGYPAIAEHDTPTETIGIAVGAASVGGSWVRASGSLLVTQYLAGEGPTGNFFDNGFIETLPATAANHMFCARGTGGPLFDAAGRMTGVASFRFVETCAEGGPGYYINLHRLRNWITTSADTLDINPIRNGDIETRSQYDAVGAIEWSGGSCSATLLSRTVALTAAQCVYNVPPQDLVFRISGELSAAVTAVLIHPQFVGDEGANLAFDVALVRLDAAAVAAWPAIGYPAIAEQEMLTETIGIAVGAASTSGSWVRVSGSLLVTQYLGAEGPVGSFFDNGFLETLPATAASQMFCARGHGGPLFGADGRITGVASFRFVETCVEGGPGYYVNLHRLRDWITTSAHALEIDDPPTDQTPQAIDDAVTTDEDRSIVIDVLENDIAPSPLATSIVSFSQGQRGSVSLGPADRLRYTPGANFHGVDSFSYVMRNDAGLTDTAVVSVTVASVNDAPVAIGVAPLLMLEDSAERTVDLSGVFEDGDGDPLTLSAREATGILSYALNDGVLAVRPLPDANGVATVAITATDPDGVSVTASMAVSIAPVNDAPTLDALTDIQVPPVQQVVVPLQGIGPGAANEQDQTVVISAVSSDPLITGAIAVVDNTLSFSPSPRTGTAAATITVQIADNGNTANGGVDRTSRSFVVTVATTGNQPPTIDPIPEQFLASGFPKFLALRASDPDGTIVAWQAENLPEGWSILGNGFQASLDGTPSGYGQGEARIRVIDSGGAIAETTFTWHTWAMFSNVVPTLTGPTTLYEDEVGHYTLWLTNLGFQTATNARIVIGPISDVAMNGCGSGVTLYCGNVASLAPGQSVYVNVILRQGTYLTGQVQGRTGPPARIDIVRVPRPMDLSLEVDAPEAVSPNAIFPVRLVARNVGPTTNASTVVTLGLPASALEHVGGSGCTIAQRVLSCQVQGFNPGDTRVFTVWLRAAARRSVAQMVASIASTGGELTPNDNIQTASVRIEGPVSLQRPDLEATVMAPATVVLPNSGLAIVRIRNLGPELVEAFSATIQFTGDGIVYPVDVAPGCLTATESRITEEGPQDVPVGPITCVGTLLPPGATVEVQVPMTVDRAGLFTITVDATPGASGRAGDPAGNNRDSALVRFRRSESDLAVTSLTGPAVLQAGQQGDYSVTITNFGPEPAVGATIRFGAASPGIGIVDRQGCTRLGNFNPQSGIECEFPGVLAPGASWTVALNARVQVNLRRNSVSVGASVRGSVSDGNDVNDQRSLTTSVQVPADVHPAISAPDRFRPGVNSTVTVVAQNLSSVAADNSRVRVELGMLNVLTAPAGCLAIASAYECAVGRVAASGEVRLNFSVIPTVNLGLATIQTSMTTTTFEVETMNNASYAQVSIYSQAPTLELNLSAASNIGAADGVATFSIANPGTIGASSVMISVTLTSSTTSAGRPQISWGTGAACTGDEGRRVGHQYVVQYSCTIAVAAGETRTLGFQGRGTGLGTVVGRASASIEGARAFGIDAVVTGTSSASVTVLVPQPTME
jgi:uncharacterized repeat protein (TIGR01451 family)